DEGKTITRSAAKAQTQELHGKIFEKILSIYASFDLVTHTAPITDVWNHSASDRRLLRIERFLLRSSNSGLQDAAWLVWPAIAHSPFGLCRLLFHQEGESFNLLLLRLVLAVLFEKIVVER